MTPERGLSICLALVATAGLAGCSGAAPAAPAAPGYDRIVTQVYGTPGQRQAADARAWWTSRMAAVECMRRAGQDYSIFGYNAPLDREYVDPGDLLGFAPARQDLDVADELIHTSATRSTLNASAQSVAAQRCETESAAPAASLVPDGQQALADELVDVLRKVQDATAPNVAGDYRTCMAAAGIPATDLADLRARAKRAFPVAEAADEYNPTNVPGWADGVAFERRAAAADAGCRTAVVKTVRTAATPQLVEFAHQHAAELDRVAAGWAWIAVDARNAEHAAGPED